MVKLLLKTPTSPPIPTRVLRYFSTQTQPQNPFSSPSSSSSSSSTFTPKEDTLYYRLVAASRPSASVIPMLDQWVTEAKPIHQSDLRGIIKRFRKCRRFNHALELAEWMSERKYMNISPGDVAVKLDLIAKVHGLRDAEKYFSSIPYTLRTLKVYGALLNCYARKRLLDKAEIVMQEMRQLGYNMTLSYNVMLNLYAKLQKHEKLHDIFQEMEEMGITCGRSTFCIMLNAYADSSNLEGIEKMLSKMEDDLLITTKWNVYVVAAKGYLKAGLAEKTSDMLEKAEKHIPSSERKIAYLLLLSKYASLGNKLEVLRIWNLYKATGDRNNVGYLYMVSSLIKMDDINEAEKILEEWESGSMMYDFRIPNLLINAYTKKGLLGKAEALVSKALESGKEPPASTWDFLATGYYKDNQMEKAVETMRKAILANQHFWKLNRATLAACLKYLKEEGHVEKAEEFATVLSEQGLNPHKSTSTPNVVVNNQRTNLQVCV